MKRFIIISILFILSLILVDTILFSVLTQINSKNIRGESGGVQNYVIKNNFDILILGSSRAKHNINPDYLDQNMNYKIFNAGLSGQGIYYVSSFIELLNAKSQLPKHILLAIDESYLLGDTNDFERINVLANYVDEPVIAERLSNINGDLYTNMMLYFPKTLRYHYRFRYLTLLRNYYFKEQKTTGYQALYGKLTKKNNLSTTVSFNSFNPEKLRIFQEMLSTLKKNNISYTLILTPTLIQSEQEIEQLKRFIMSKNEVLFCFDRFSDNIFKDQSLYKDKTHLNNRGSAILSEKLFSQLNRKLRSQFENTVKVKPL